jgi:hypothetical protein
MTEFQQMFTFYKMRNKVSWLPTLMKCANECYQLGCFIFY